VEERVESKGGAVARVGQNAGGLLLDADLHDGRAPRAHESSGGGYRWKGFPVPVSRTLFPSLKK